MHMFWFLIVGIVAGWLAGLLIKGEGFGLLGDMLIGIIGAYIGGYLFGVLGLSVHGMLGHIIMATAVLAMIPPALVVVLMQRWFVKGLVDTEK